MNTGAEAVDTALKLARRWGYVKVVVSVGNDVKYVLMLSRVLERNSARPGDRTGMRGDFPRAQSCRHQHVYGPDFVRWVWAHTSKCWAELSRGV